MQVMIFEIYIAKGKFSLNILNVNGYSLLDIWIGKSKWVELFGVKVYVKEPC